MVLRSLVSTACSTGHLSVDRSGAPGQPEPARLNLKDRPANYTNSTIDDKQFGYFRDPPVELISGPVPLLSMLARAG